MLNNCVFEGRLVRDADVNRTAGGVAVAKFTIAVGSAPNKNGEKDTLFLPVTVFGRTAETIAKHFHKGDSIIVSGRLSSHCYDSRKTGARMVAFELAASSFEFPLAGNSASGDARQSQERRYPQGESQTHDKAEGDPLEGLDLSEDDLPF